MEEVRRVGLAVTRRIQSGEDFSVEMLNEELRKWEALPETRNILPPYFRAQVCYILLNQSEVNDASIMDHSVPVDILAAWGEAIARDGLEANIEIPDDLQMRKILSRRIRFESRREWEKQGHTHRTDGLSLLERIYAVHEVVLQMQIS